MALETDLEAMLDRSYEALLTGDLPALGLLGDALNQLSETLPFLDRSAAKRLQVKAERNEQMLQAASRGIRAARYRLIEISASPTLTTYNSRGRKESFSPLSPMIPKRL